MSSRLLIETLDGRVAFKNQQNNNKDVDEVKSFQFVTQIEVQNKTNQQLQNVTNDHKIYINHAKRIKDQIIIIVEYICIKEYIRTLRVIHI